jgi:hypothetical protein
MLNFKSYLNEEVTPTAQIVDGSFDIERPEVRDQINATLTSLCSRIVVTPYVIYNKVSKALAYFHIILPKRAYLEGDRGVDVIPIQQFGIKMGMTDKGEFVKEVPPSHYLYISYQMIGTGYSVRAKMVGKEELDNLLSDTEIKLAEESQLDELSRDKLSRYIKKASDSRAREQQNTGEADAKTKDEKLKSGERKKAGKELGTAYRKVINRRNGIIRATDRLSK